MKRWLFLIFTALTAGGIAVVSCGPDDERPDAEGLSPARLLDARRADALPPQCGAGTVRVHDGCAVLREIAPSPGYCEGGFCALAPWPARGEIDAVLQAGEALYVHAGARLLVNDDDGWRDLGVDLRPLLVEEGALWAGGDDDAPWLASFDGAKWTPVERPEGAGEVRALLRDDDALHVGTCANRQGLLFELREGELLPAPAPAGEPGACVEGLLRAPNGALLADVITRSGGALPYVSTSLLKRTDAGWEPLSLPGPIARVGDELVWVRFVGLMPQLVVSAWPGDPAAPALELPPPEGRGTDERPDPRVNGARTLADAALHFGSNHVAIVPAEGAPRVLAAPRPLSTVDGAAEELVAAAIGREGALRWTGGAWRDLTELPQVRAVRSDGERAVVVGELLGWTEGAAWRILEQPTTAVFVDERGLWAVTKPTWRAASALLRQDEGGAWRTVAESDGDAWLDVFVDARGVATVLASDGVSSRVLRVSEGHVEVLDQIPGGQSRILGDDQPRWIVGTNLFRYEAREWVEVGVDFVPRGAILYKDALLVSGNHQVFLVDERGAQLACDTPGFSGIAGAEPVRDAKGRILWPLDQRLLVLEDGEWSLITGPEHLRGAATVAGRTYVFGARSLYTLDLDGAERERLDCDPL